jgi:hypothetical protein
MGVFETSEQNGSRSLQPVRVPTLKQDIFGQARDLCSDLDGWDVVEVDETNLKITCKRSNGLLGGTSQIEVWVEGPDAIPSSTTHVRSESSGALLSRDKSNVAEFVKKFTMRVC